MAPILRSQTKNQMDNQMNGNNNAIRSTQPTLVIILLYLKILITNRRMEP